MKKKHEKILLPNYYQSEGDNNITNGEVNYD